MSRIKKIVRKIIPSSNVRQVEDLYRLRKAQTATAVFRNPSKGLKVIAVTGTNGKTTTCTFIGSVLAAAGYRTAIYTTAYTSVGKVYEPNRSHMTVASPWSVQKFLSKAKSAGVDWVVLEVTSHALEQHRLYGVSVEIAVVTNLSQDHLDYHGTMEKYAAAKARLITEFKPHVCVLNADDEWFSYFARRVKKDLVTVGQGRATSQLKNMKFAPNGSQFSLIGPKGALELKTHLVGEFNAYNAAMAATVGLEIGISREQVEAGVANVPIVPGRLEPIDEGQPFGVLVDYAHTPDALMQVLESLNNVTKGRVRVVFGATGDRDKTKRVTMGDVAARFADFVYLTDDETYTENPQLIRDAVRDGILAAGGKDKYVEIGDRKEAIRQAFKDAESGDVVLLAGIGHQDYRNMGGKKLKWDEREVARELLSLEQ